MGKAKETIGRGWLELLGRSYLFTAGAVPGAWAWYHKVWDYSKYFPFLKGIAQYWGKHEHGGHLMTIEESAFFLDELYKNGYQVDLGLCPCRALGNPGGCKAPLWTCIVIGRLSQLATLRNPMRCVVDEETAVKELFNAEAHGLMHQAGMCHEGHYYLCSCCECCCVVYQMMGSSMLKRGFYISTVDPEKCVGCGKCVAVCPFNARSLERWVGAPGGAFEGALVPGIYEKHGKRAWVWAFGPFDKCFGCGLCRNACAYDAIKMVPRTEPDPGWDLRYIKPSKEYTIRVTQKGSPELHIEFKHPESFEKGREVLRKYARTIAERQVTGIPKIMYERE